jgi:mevalonate kinase
MIQSSAPGKLMLLGDYSVVYNNPCLVTAVDKRIHVDMEVIEGAQDEIITPQVKESTFVLKTVNTFKKKFSVTKAVRITTHADFSNTVGLGSSSAVTVATLNALCKLFSKNLDKKELFTFCYEVVLSIQGVGSGFDIAAAVYGGTLYYVTGGKIIEPLTVQELPLVVGYSGVKANTAQYIKKVAVEFKDKQRELATIFSSISSLVERARIGIEKNNFAEVGLCMTENHSFLQKLGVSIPKLDSMVEAAIQAGAWGAKLSGAGGGDCMIALVSEDKRIGVEQAIEKVGGEVIRVGLNAQGVK